MNANEFVKMFGGNDSKQTKIRYAKIDPNYTSGRPSLVFDGETIASSKHYPYLSSYEPVPNDRVMIIQGVVIGKIV